jgi:prepilin-type N-terminal cleavage/methylation domain-containing protein
MGVAKRRQNRGYTLIEVIIAITLFAIIMMAVSLSVNAAFSASKASQERQQEANDARGVFHFLLQDLEAAFISSVNPASVFIGSGGSTSGLTGNSGVLTLSTKVHLLPSAGLMTEGSTQSAPAPPQAGAGMPQSEVELVRYEFNRSEGTLSRITLPVPNVGSVTQMPAQPETLIARNVQEINLRFWDKENRVWRPNWDYQQRNQAQSNDQQSGQQNTATGDSTLPSAVEITVLIRRESGEITPFVTTVPIISPEPIQQTPPPNSGGNQNQNQNQNPSGNSGNNSNNSNNGTNRPRT